MFVFVSRKWWIDFDETLKGGERDKDDPFNYGEGVV